MARARRAARAAAAGADLRSAAAAPARRSADLSGTQATRPIGPGAFTAFAIACFGGPLAIAALNAPGLAGAASDSAGLAMVLAAAAFAVPLWIWLRYAAEIPSAGGLFAFVEAAAGRRLALAQAAIWIFSYALYLVYTTVQIVYDILPQVLPGEAGWQTWLALAIPVTIAGVMIAGRGPMLVVLGLIGLGQLALAGVLAGVGIAHLGLPASSFGAGAPARGLAKAGAQTSLLYVCGSLPLFLGGELADAARTTRRGLTVAFGLSAAVVVLAVAPLAAAPGLANTAIPGVTLAQEYSGQTLADAIGIGVAASTAGLILAEYVALGRLLHALASWRLRSINVAIGVAMVLVAPFTLIDPEGFYTTLSSPSLVALWVSQLIVFAVYPRFAISRGRRPLPALALGAGASALAIYGVVVAVQQSVS